MRREFTELCKDFATIRANLAATLASGAVAPGHRPFLEALATEFDQALAGFNKDFPAGLDELERRQQANRDLAAELEKQRAQLEHQAQTIEAKPLQPVPTAPVVPKPVFDPKYGETLRAGLLLLAGVQPASPSRTRDAGEVWDMSSGTWQTKTDGE